MRHKPYGGPPVLLILPVFLFILMMKWFFKGVVALCDAIEPQDKRRRK